MFVLSAYSTHEEDGLISFHPHQCFWALFLISFVIPLSSWKIDIILTYAGTHILLIDGKSTHENMTVKFLFAIIIFFCTSSLVCLQYPKAHEN